MDKPHSSVLVAYAKGSNRVRRETRFLVVAISVFGATIFELSYFNGWNRSVLAKIEIIISQRQCLALKRDGDTIVFQDLQLGANLPFEGDFSKITDRRGVCFIRRPPACLVRETEELLKENVLDQDTIYLYVGPLRTPS